MLAANAIAPLSAPSRSNAAEFAALIKPLEKVLFARAMGLERSRADARDLVQDTLERGLRNFHQFTSGTNLKLWLFRIMYNLFVDRYRRRSPEQLSDSIEGLELAAPVPDAPEAWENVDQQLVNSSLERLDAPFRQVLELHFLNERSYRDIGAELGIPTGTVGTRILRARKKLQRMLSHELRQAAA